MRMLLRTYSFLLLGLSASAQVTWYVDDDGTAPGSGTLADPFTTIALATQYPSVANGDIIQIAPGLYDEADILMERELALRGAGMDQTKVTGSGSGSLVTALQGGSISDLTLRNNISTGPGGGLHVMGFGQYSFEAKRVRIEGCSGTDGGGIYADTALHLLVEDCEILNNRALDDNEWGYGGGIYAYETDLLAVGCLIEGNRASAGGGICGGEPSFPENESLVRSCKIIGNVARDSGCCSNYGGGLVFCDAEDCWIRGNRSESVYFGGGGVARGTATRCLIEQNTSSLVGGGAWDTILRLCEVRDNTAEYGGAISYSQAFQCTIYRNAAMVGSVAGTNDSFFGGGLLDSCIIQGHTGVPFQFSSVKFSLVDDGSGANNLEGNIFGEDPLFWYPVTGDTHLKPGSPAIDAGNPSLPLDTDGSRADMGAYPFDPAYLPGPGRYCDAQANSSGCSATLSSSGTPSLGGPDDFALHATGAPPSEIAVFVWSARPAQQSFAGATLCVAQPRMRSAPEVVTGSGCSSWVSTGLPRAELTAGGLLPFQNLYAQLWYRDSGAVPHFAGLSDALEFTVIP